MKRVNIIIGLSAAVPFVGLNALFFYATHSWEWYSKLYTDQAMFGYLVVVEAFIFTGSALLSFLTAYGLSQPDSGLRKVFRIPEEEADEDTRMIRSISQIITENRKRRGDK